MKTLLLIIAAALLLSSCGSGYKPFDAAVKASIAKDQLNKYEKEMTARTDSLLNSN